MIPSLPQCATEVSKPKKTLYEFGRPYHILNHKLSPFWSLKARFHDLIGRKIDLFDFEWTFLTKLVLLPYLLTKYMGLEIFLLNLVAMSRKPKWLSGKALDKNFSLFFLSGRTLVRILVETNIFGHFWSFWHDNTGQILI